MMMINKSVQVQGGKYAGLVGVVEAQKDTTAKVRLEGVPNVDGCTVTAWLKLSQLAVL